MVAGNQNKQNKATALIKGGTRTTTVGGPVTVINRYVPTDTSPEGLAAKLREFQKSSWRDLDEPEEKSSDYYFNSYAHFGIHEDMLKDSVRTGAYRRAIVDNPHLFKDKIVLDVGAGTGVLSMFAAKAGAKHVYAIECSEICHLARKLVKHNGYQDRITVIQSKAEDTELPVDKVDIIVSEWMGYFLLYESMLDTVLFCRDKWLRDGGLIFPDRATLHLAAIEDGEYRKEKFDWWSNCYGLDYSPVKKCIMEEPIVDTVQDCAVVTEACCVLDLNLYTCKVEDLDFAAPFRLKFNRQDFAHALIAWFDCEFTACHSTVAFSTGPFSFYTHWKQTVFYLEHIVTGHKNEEIKGFIAVRKNSKNHRDLDIKLQYSFHGRVGSVEHEQLHRIR
eukprot:Gregarina_sp_Poly_1__7481@NODE_416_length_8734_cov_134_157609_g338_i0_p4_GENE_NODE_416_length_8734_cov_134_157609_g338_i0NODE_416_length_8734_cov_134_157609_g338_i0_p4_ORF_typecomplete_len390_score55_90PrmA/PF06325_13/6_7e24Methyltransf_25/PF13649_6/1_1e03Methyltransf_25/PF13649_6/1_3e14Methyltransf_25/PF13649_6/1_7e03Methyltransf_31/PF13847_6/3_9e12MTS/PF05175_14/3_3e12PRMT5/PF05185_16/9_3e12CMAS/PF02353_20/1_8e10Methyltransf_16/PF10294_9/3e10Cons_hypoth95/PF03602_15/2_1e09Methyltransf_23/PF134